MPTEKINYTDNLKQGTDKLNSAIEAANTAETLSTNADQKATQALTNSESTQDQLDTIVINGDSSVEAAQARVSVEGTTYTTLRDRLDNEYQSITADLADITQVFRSQPGTPGSTSGLEAVNTITGYKDNAVTTDIRGADVGQGSEFNENVVGAVLDTIGVPNAKNVSDPNSKTANYAFVRGYDNGVNGLADVVIAYHVKAHEAATHATVVGGSYHEVTDGDYNAIVGGTKTFMEYLAGGGYNFAGGGNTNTLYSRFSSILASLNSRIGTAVANKEFSGVLNSNLSTVDGNYAIVLAGNECKATKDYSTARGKGAVANNVGESAFSTGKYKTAGDSFQSLMHLFRQTTTGVQTQLLLDDNNSTIQPLGVNTAIAIEASIIGYRVDAEGSARFKISATIERRSGAPIIRNLTVTPEYKSDALYDADVIVSSNAYQIRVKGVSGHTINWTGRLHTEVSRDI